MKSCLIILIILFSSCARQPENASQSDDYVLIEFASKLEEDQAKFEKLGGSKKFSTGP